MSDINSVVLPDLSAWGIGPPLLEPSTPFNGYGPFYPPQSTLQESFLSHIGTDTAYGGIQTAPNPGTSVATDYGVGAVASGNYAAAFGAYSSALDASTVAIGYGTKASRTYGVAVGSQALASGYAGIALGYTANTTGAYSVGIGFKTFTSGPNSVVIGYGILSGTGSNNVAVGALASTATNNTSQNVAIGAASSATGGTAVVIGYQASSPGPSDVVIGKGANASGITGSNVLIGATAAAGGSQCVVIGATASVTGNTNVVIGYGAVAGNVSATTIVGTNSTSTLLASVNVIIGANNTVTHTGCCVIGNSYSSTANNQMVIKGGAYALIFPATAGTANYALTTDGAGITSWSSGQSVAGLLTSSTPQFARLGLGAPADATALLYLSGSSAYAQISDTGTNATLFRAFTNSNTQEMIVGQERAAGGAIFVGSAAYAAVFGSAGASTAQFATNNTVRWTIDTSGNILAGGASGNQILSSTGIGVKGVDSVFNASGSALATNATVGFPFIPTCAGTPTGTPTTVTGAAAEVWDSTNKLYYIYSGAAWNRVSGMTIKAIQRFTITLNGVATGTATVTAVVLANTELRLLGFDETSLVGTDPPYIQMTNTTTVTATRVGTGGTVIVSGELTEWQ